jgi:hypothetical protein
MHYYQAFGLHISSELALPELSDGDSGQAPDLYIQSGTINLPALGQTQIFRRGIQAWFGQDDAGNLYLHWPGIATFRASSATHLTVAADTSDPDILSLFTVSEALGLILFQRGYLLLHASAVKVGDEAWCFMGEPGAGKSSTAAAFIKAGCQLLSDDLTAINFDSNQKPLVIPSYPQLKIWSRTVQGLSYDQDTLRPVSEGVNKFSYQPKSDFPDQPVPLSKVFFLQKETMTPGSRKLSAAEVPAEMLKNFPLAADLLTSEVLKKHFLQSLHCAQHAEIVRQGRPNGFEQLGLWVSQALSGQISVG